MKKVAIIGGGLMGSGIATALLLSNINVILKEVNSEFLSRGIKSIEGKYVSLLAKCLFDCLSASLFLNLSFIVGV